MKDIHFAAFCHFLADLFSILNRLSLQLQRNDILFPTVVSYLKETMLRVETLAKRPVADGHLAKFWQKVEGTETFQGVNVTGSIQGKANRGGSTSGSLESEMVTAVNLTTQGLRERFGVLLGAKNQGSKAPITALNKWSATCWCSMSTAGQHIPVTCWITEEKRLGT